METNEIRVKKEMERGQAIEYLQAVINSMRQGRVTIEHADETLALTPPAGVTVQVKARRKRDKESVSVKLSWEVPGETEEAAASDLRISADEPKGATPAE